MLKCCLLYTFGWLGDPLLKSPPKPKPKSRGKRQPNWSVQEVLQRLEPEYGPPAPPRKWEPIGELVYTILSQHTADINSVPAYERLIAALPTWDQIAEAPIEAVIAPIQRGGLAQIKGPRIQAVLREVKARTGGYDLSFLGEMPLEEAKAWLRALPGVGPKTVGCVLLFSLDMPAIVVYTHVYRVALRLGFYDKTVNPDKSHDLLESILKPEEIMPFHMYLIQHGRRVCKAMRPLCEACVLEGKCPASLLRNPVAKKTRVLAAA